MKNKILIGAIFLIILAAVAYTSFAVKSGMDKQSIVELKQALEDNENNLKLFQRVAQNNSEIVLKTQSQKAILNSYALKVANELEVLKSENENIKKWANTYIPNLLSIRLYEFSRQDKISIAADSDRITTANTGAVIEILNQSAYQYAIDNLTALRQCNKDKAGALESFLNTKE